MTSHIARAQLEESIARPVRQHPKEVAQLRLGIEFVQPGGSDQREQIPRGVGMVIAIAADKSQFLQQSAMRRSSRSDALLSSMSPSS